MKGITHPCLKMFKKKQFIGRGGFSDVWKVSYFKGDYILAMKQLSKSEIIKKKFVSNIFAERDILNIMYNDHIVNLYSTFQDQNYLYMIMDYLEGGDLRKHMKQKIFNEKEIKFVAACTIIGLELIHGKKIIHRDIKPENLIFDEKGYLRISDFGIAIRNDKISEREKYNDKSGTPGYMAPERIIIDKNKTYNYSSDFFSLGVILYELTTLKLPFVKNNDKIGVEQYTSYDAIIYDLFNNEPINLNPTQVKNYRNKYKDKYENVNINDEELTNLCDLINKLLIYDQEKRLGYGDIEAIKNHPFFGDKFEWKKIFHRSIKSPFDIYKLKKNENSKNDHNNSKSIISDDCDEKNETFQNKFENFTSIHNITKDELNFFYSKGEMSGNLLKFRNQSSKKISKGNNSTSVKKKSSSVFSKKNQYFFSQSKNESNIKFKILPRNLFNKDNENIKNNNEHEILNLKNIHTKLNIPNDNFEDDKNLNQTNFNFYKKNSKINIFNKNSFLPRIYSKKNEDYFLQKPSSAYPFKKNRSRIQDDSKEKSKIILGKNAFKESCINLSNIRNKKILRIKNGYIHTDNNLLNSKTSRKVNEKSELLKKIDIQLFNSQLKDRLKESSHKSFGKKKSKHIFYIH